MSSRPAHSAGISTLRRNQTVPLVLRSNSFHWAGRAGAVPVRVVVGALRPAGGKAAVLRFRRQVGEQCRFEIAHRYFELLGGERIPVFGAARPEQVFGISSGDIRIPRQGFAAGPRLGDRAAPARCENADRNCELVGQLLCEEEGHGAPVVDRGRRRSLPGGVDIPGRGQQRIARHGQHADRVEFTGVGPPSQLRAAVGERGNLEFHVRLPGGEPDFSERDVLRRRRFAAFELGDLKRQADGGRHRREAEQEFPVRAGTGFGTPVPERGADPAERCAPAPDRNGPVSLQNGVVPEQCGEFQHGFFSCIDSIF